MKNILVILILVVVIGLALYYIFRQKKKGINCIGCPSGVKCPLKSGERCNGNCYTENK